MIGGRNTASAVLMATLGAGVIIAHQVAAKATRDALFLSIFKATSLPQMYFGAALFSIALVLLTSRAMARAGPARWVPAAFWASGILHLAEWALFFRFEREVAVALYLHFNGLGAILISGFWSMVNERFDPHTARKRMGQIAGGGIVGALIGGSIGAFLTKPILMLPVLCAMHLLCGLILQSLKPDAERLGPPGKEAAGDLDAGTRLLTKLPYLRHLALLVLVGAAGATMVDQVFKIQAQLAFPQQEELLRFFALFYTAASLVGWVIHTVLTRLLLEKAGLGVTVSALPATVTLGSLGAAFIPGLPSAGIARGSELVAHSTLFRSAYELFYTSVPPAEKRSAKQIIDVGFERLGDMLGAAVNKGLLQLGPLLASRAILGAAAIAGLFGLWIARRLDRGYVLALERSLRDRAVELNLEEVRDHTTRATLMRSMPEWQPGFRPRTEAREEKLPASLDPVLGRIAELRSGDPRRVRKALQEAPLETPLAAHVIPLLAWDPVAEDAQRALRHAGSAITGQLIDAMLDSSQDFAVRRRVPRLLAALPSARSMEALFLGLNDKRFEVRFRCGKALARLLAVDAGLRPADDQVLDAVARELGLSRHLWESHRLLDGFEEDELVGERANRGLEHVFTLLSLILPKEPLRLSFQALHTDDEILRGTALEYLESILPPPVMDRLWPFLEDRRSPRSAPRSREEILAELVHSHESIRIKLHELRKIEEP